MTTELGSQSGQPRAPEIESIFKGDLYANSPYSAGHMVARRSFFLDKLFQNQEAKALSAKC